MARQRVHELTSEGIAAAKAWLTALRSGLSIPFPDTLLTSPPYARPVVPEIYVTDRTFNSRRDAGLYFVRTLAPLRASQGVSRTNLWSWLGMFYFGEVVRKDSNGNPRLGRDPDIAYVIDSKDQEWQYHRHRLMLSYDIYRQHGDDAWFMLDEPVNSMSDFTDRLVGSPERFRSVGIVKLAHILYADIKTRNIKPGVSVRGRANRSPGGLRRLTDVLNQLYMTYDVYGMPAEQILPLLPTEFDRFKPSNG